MAERQPSRFSTFNVFTKISGSRPPRPPPKDAYYMHPSKSAVSVALNPSQGFSFSNSYASSSHDTLTINAPQSASGHSEQSEFTANSGRSSSPVPSQFTSVTSVTTVPIEDHPPPTEFGGISSFKKGLSKLSSSFPKRRKGSGAGANASPGIGSLLPAAASSTISVNTFASRNPSDGDEGISKPWGFKHDLHVDEGLSNLPQEWLTSLRGAGLTDDEIMTIHQRRQRAASTSRTNHDVPFTAPTTITSFGPISGPSTNSTPVKLPSAKSAPPITTAVSIENKSSSSPTAYLSPASLPSRSSSLRRLPQQQKSFTQSTSPSDNRPKPLRKGTDNQSIRSTSTNTASTNSSPVQAPLPPSRYIASQLEAETLPSHSDRISDRRQALSDRSGSDSPSRSSVHTARSNEQSLPNVSDTQISARFNPPYRQGSPAPGLSTAPHTPRTPTLRVFNPTETVIDPELDDEHIEGDLALTSSPPPAYALGDYMHKRGQGSVSGPSAFGDIKVKPQKSSDPPVQEEERGRRLSRASDSTQQPHATPPPDVSQDSTPRQEQKLTKPLAKIELPARDDTFSRAPRPRSASGTRSAATGLQVPPPLPIPPPREPRKQNSISSTSSTPAELSRAKSKSKAVSPTNGPPVLTLQLSHEEAKPSEPLSVEDDEVPELSSPVPISLMRSSRPPRISLHQDLDPDGDIASWSASLLLAVSSTAPDPDPTFDVPSPSSSSAATSLKLDSAVSTNQSQGPQSATFERSFSFDSSRSGGSKGPMSAGTVASGWSERFAQTQVQPMPQSNPQRAHASKAAPPPPLNLSFEPPRATSDFGPAASSSSGSRIRDSSLPLTPLFKEVYRLVSPDGRGSLDASHPPMSTTPPKTVHEPMSSPEQEIEATLRASRDEDDHVDELRLSVTSPSKKKQRSSGGSVLSGTSDGSRDSSRWSKATIVRKTSIKVAKRGFANVITMTAHATKVPPAVVASLTPSEQSLDPQSEEQSEEAEAAKVETLLNSPSGTRPASPPSPNSERSSSSGSSSGVQPFSVTSNSSTENEVNYLAYDSQDSPAPQAPPEDKTKLTANYLPPLSDLHPMNSRRDTSMSGLSDFSPLVNGWLVESPPAGSYMKEMVGDVKRDSITVYDYEQEHQRVGDAPQSLQKPSITISGATSPRSPSFADTSPSPEKSPATPVSRYRGWLSEVVAPLQEFIDETIDPREVFVDLREIAEGESGSVFVADYRPDGLPQGHKPKSPLFGTDVNTDGQVAIKNVPILPSGSPKLLDLRRELLLMTPVRHAHVLSMSGLYVDLVEDSLWISMELMERSVADVLSLANEGLVLHEKAIARLLGDVLLALTYLETVGIVHRDIRSDNLLINSEGLLKIADFSHAIQVDANDSIRSETVGVLYWQAPEIRRGPYDARKIDLWSVGATAWEMAESEPPFASLEDPRQVSETLPAISRPEIYSRSFHDFIRFCSSPASSRPSAQEALQHIFIRSACARSAIMDLLSRCRDIEDLLLRRQSTDSEGTIQS